MNPWDRPVMILANMMPLITPWIVLELDLVLKKRAVVA